jgi:hypothetical protein
VQPANGRVKQEGDGDVLHIPRDHVALRAPEGYMSLFKTLQEYLLRLEYTLWGVLDRGWAGMVERCTVVANRSFWGLPALCTQQTLRRHA